METTQLTPSRAGLLEGGTALARLVVVAMIVLVTVASAASVVLAL